MISATAVTVPAGNTTAPGNVVQLGPFTNALVTISNLSGVTVFLGMVPGTLANPLSSTTCFPVPTGTVLPLGRVSGTLWACQVVSAGSAVTIGLLVTTPN